MKLTVAGSMSDPKAGKSALAVDQNPAATPSLRGSEPDA